MDRGTFFRKALAAAIGAPFAARALLQQSGYGYATGLVSTPLEVETLTGFVPAVGTFTAVASAAGTLSTVTWIEHASVDAALAPDWQI